MSRWGGQKWKGPFALRVTQTCNSPAAFLVWVSGLLHPGENLFVRRTFGVLLLWPQWRCALRRPRLRQLWVRGRLTGAAKPSDITQKLAGEVLLLLLQLLEVVCGAVFLHFHAGPPFLTFWRSTGGQMSHGRFPESPELLAWEDPGKKERETETESGRRPHDPSYQLNSKLTWIASLSCLQRRRKMSVCL